MKNSPLPTQAKWNDYYRGRIMQATYFSGVTLPVTMRHLETCLCKGREIVDMPEGTFQGEGKK